MNQPEQDLLQQAEHLFKEKSYQEIILLLPDEILEKSNNAILYALKARALARLGKIDLCLAYAQKAISIDPLLASAYVARGNAMYHQKEYEKALEDYNKAIQLDENDSYNYYNRALIWNNYRQYDKALEDCDTAILLDENNSAAYYTRGNVWSNLKRPEKALEDYNKAIELDEHYSTAYLSRGNLWFNQKNYEKALEDYNKAIQTDETYTLAYLNRANVLYNQKKYKKAIADYNKVIELDKNYVTAYLGRAVVFYNQQKYDKAVSDYNKVIELDEKNKHAYNNRGNVLYETREYEKAIEDYNKAIKLDEKYYSSYYNRALSYSELGKYQKAIDDYNRYIKLNNTEDYYLKVALSEIEKLKKNITNKGYEEVDRLVKEIKQLLLYNKPQLTHYTSLSGAKALILEGSPFRLSEGAFLNDTSEGRELFNYLSFAMTKFNKHETIAEIFVEKPFIGSFVPDNKHDDLTLWRMYGKEAQAEAKGCALTIYKEKFIKNLETSLSQGFNMNGNFFQSEGKFTFYKVAYRTKDKFVIPEDNVKNNRIFNKLLQELKTKISSLNEKERIPTVKLLNDIAYLFKSAEYQYEHEVRLVVQGVGFKKNIENVNYPPKVYVELIDIVPVLHKITLGPKVERADEWAAAFNYHIKEKNEDTYLLSDKDEKIEIIISHLPFK